jgi:hypothetical protein
VLGVIGRIAAAGLRHCPHYLGAGIGLLASAHVLAANARDDSWLEVDANENPLRTLLCPPLATLRAGRITLGAAPGLGVDPDLAALREMCKAAARRRVASAHARAAPRASARQRRQRAQVGDERVEVVVAIPGVPRERHRLGERRPSRPTPCAMARLISASLHAPRPCSRSLVTLRETEPVHRSGRPLDERRQERPAAGAERAVEQSLPLSTGVWHSRQWPIVARYAPRRTLSFMSASVKRARRGANGSRSTGAR